MTTQTDWARQENRWEDAQLHDDGLGHGRFAQGYDTLRRDALIEGLKVARFFKRRRLHHCFERAKPLPKVSEASDV